MATKKTTYVATAPDGTEITRGTNRTYTHAVLVYSDDTEYVRDADGGYVFEERLTADGKPYRLRAERIIGQSWGQLSFNGSKELAVKNAASWAKKSIKGFHQIIVVPVAAR